MNTEATLNFNRPCDHCRSGKRRCDGPGLLDRVCTRCARVGRTCTYSEASPREVRHPKGYIEALEARTAKIQSLLLRLAPQTHLMRELGLLTISTIPSVHPPPPGVYQEPDVRRSLAATLCPLEELYIQRVGHSNALRRRYALDDPFTQKPDSRLPFSKRSEYWSVPEYEFRKERLPDRHFDSQLPPPERLALLVRRYFETFNVVYPIFHQELFERQLVHPALMFDAHFVAVVLLVCALGECQLAGDALLNFGEAPSGPSTSGRSGSEPAGLKYFTQVEPFLRMSTSAEPRLLEVQIFYLASLYIGIVLGSTTFWLQLDTAIQMAIQRDDHRRRQGTVPNLMDELKIRTFWSLVVTDRRAASIFGRPTCIKDDAFDLDFPLEVDDVRWDLSTIGFPLIGPPVRDSYTSSFFSWQVRLSLVQGFIIQTIYLASRTRTLMGFIGADWEQRMMQRLDSLLLDWRTNLPSSLSWHPSIADMKVFLQSSYLHTMYHTLVIMAHNPFLRTKASEFSRASQDMKTGLDLVEALNICTNAALKTTDILTLLVDRLPWAFGLPGLMEPPVCGEKTALHTRHRYMSHRSQAMFGTFKDEWSTVRRPLRLLILVLSELLHRLFAEAVDESATLSPLSTPASADFQSPTSEPMLASPTSNLYEETPQPMFNIDLVPSSLKKQMANDMHEHVLPLPMYSVAA
ncbi:fungal-specific transcription factor domain-containing protein [Auriculariales sp. MPI-PUGE-AT-0066]|nr:fungal-specific transcription factor domain-containing protein [Auriculariales sp. MPI-PUGE-AT-0066]